MFTSTLRFLWLYENQINTIHPLALTALQSLELLDLSNNNINDLDSITFNELINLMDLRLSNNRLINFQPNIFNKLNQLKSLSIDGNQLENEFNGKMFGEQNQLITLNTLNANKSNIYFVEQNTFLYTPNIKELNLAFNRIVSYLL